MGESGKSEEEGMKVREWTGRARVRLTCGDCMDGLKAQRKECEKTINQPLTVKRLSEILTPVNEINTTNEG